MTISKSEFLETIRKSQVLTDQQFQTWTDNPDTDGVRIANQMVREKVLTEWQAKFLLTGRHYLDIGPYRLLERTQRDELGDRFSAIHRQLGRHVDLQMISAALSKDQSQYQAFIERVGQTSKLDHPHISHVYDVDKAGGRFYLVTEHIDGERFSNLKGNGLDLASVADWLHQAMLGLKVVHAQGLVHGDLRIEDLMIDREYGVKIQNLAITELRMPLAAKQIGPEGAMHDWRSLGKIFQEINKQVASTHSSTDQTEWLTLIHELANGREVGLIDRLEQRLAVVRSNLHRENAEDQLIGAKLDRIDDQDYGAAEEPEYVSKTPSARNRVQAAVAAKTNSKRRLAGADQDEAEEDENFDSGLFARIALGNPVGLLSSAFVFGLMLAGSLTYVILGSFADRSVAQANVSFKNETGDTLTQKKIVPTSLKREHEQSTTSDSSSLEKKNLAAVNTTEKQTEPKTEMNFPPVNAFPGQSPTVLNSASQIPPEQDTVPASTDQSGLSGSSMSTNILSAPLSDSETQTVVAQPKQLDETQPASTQPSPAQPTPAQPTPIQPAPDQSASTPPASTPPASTPPVSTQPAPSDNGSTQPAATSSVTPEDLQERLENPFGQFPSQVALPSIDDTKEAKLGDVFIADRFLLGAELVLNPAISRGKIHFETERDKTNNQRWLIHVSRTPKDKKSPIAAIRRDGQEVFFQWLPEAQGNRQSGWLKNCLLKLFVPDKSILLPLRKPVEIEPLVLKSDALTAETTFELDFLPEQEVLVVEVLPVTIDQTRLQPSVIDLNGRNPARVLLKRKDDKAALWVNLALELKEKSVLRADLLATDGAQIRAIKNLSELQAIASSWRQQEMILDQQVATAEATPAPRGKGEEKDRFISGLNRQKRHAESYADKFEDYVPLAPKMMGHPYGIRIIARYEGVEVELARTKSNPSPATNN